MAKQGDTLKDYLFSKTFLKHGAGALLVLSLLVFLSLQLINSLTEHGESVEVPNFVGVKTIDLDSYSNDKHVRYVIIDSVFDPEKPKGVVIDQNPLAKVKVKDNRTIYLTVSRILPPQIQMPNLVDVSLRQATAILESHGLKLGAITYVPDIAQNAVLDQRFKGKKIAQGTPVPYGSVIDLVLGKGEGEEEVAIPYLVGMTRKEALDELNLAGLIVGSEQYDTKASDSTKVLVYKQTPRYLSGQKLKQGSSVDLFYTTDKNKVEIDTGDNTFVKDPDDE